YYHLSTRRGWRCSTADAYLGPARARRNLRVITGARVTRIVFDGRRATGVVYRGAAGDVELRAAHEVLLCAGAVQTPQLLQLSGAGPRPPRAGCGIPPLG